MIHFLVFVSIIAIIATPQDRKQRHQFAKNVLNKSMNMAVDQFGLPPNEEKALSFARDLHIAIRIEGPDEYVWDSHPKEGPALISRKFLRQKVERGDWIVHFSPLKLKQFPTAEFIGIKALLIFLVLGISYFWVRKIFYPLKDFQSAFSRVREGDLKTSVPNYKSLVFQELGSTFNQMTRKLVEERDSLKNLILSVSHEYRTPLTRMNIELEGIEDKKIKQSLRSEIKLLDSITSKILETEKILNNPLELNKTNVLMNQFLIELIDSYGLDKDRIKIITTNDFELSVDLPRLQIATKTLIDNSLKFSESEITLTLKKESLSIVDQGSGIDQKILEELETNKRIKETQNLGLGLRLAKTIIEAHQFQFKIDSSSKGTTVKIIF